MTFLSKMASFVLYLYKRYYNQTCHIEFLSKTLLKKNLKNIMNDNFDCLFVFIPNVYGQKPSWYQHLMIILLITRIEVQ